ncbi:MAG: hypothetical protein FWG10_14300 [Eubacteriaceae bacterium]|nr:hypothetical protein [Eubacteriaceae bacterium]
MKYIGGARSKFPEDSEFVCGYEAGSLGQRYATSLQSAAPHQSGNARQL